MKISVIMAATLDPFTYECENGFVITSASNMGYKFKRAVDSFLGQSYKNKELIIVSDGCKRVGEIVNISYSAEKHSKLIKLLELRKQPTFSGLIRKTGLEIATGEIICFLDADDFIGREHLRIIADNFNPRKHDWCYYNDYLVRNINDIYVEERDVQPERTKVGTSSIVFRGGLEVEWPDINGHDWYMIEKYLLPLDGIKIRTAEYFVCHCSQLAIDN
jgi:glycosyltransferase involved in cell wall biosynthesis